MEYEVNEATYAIIPYEKEKAKVIEYDDEYIIDSSPYEIMEYSCEYFGSSLEGRVIGSKSILGTIYKVPLMIDDALDMIFFPTKSPNSSKNVWISLKNIDSYQKIGTKTLVMFKNSKKLLIDVPYYSFDNQVLRATRLEAIAKDRKSKKKVTKTQL